VAHCTGSGQMMMIEKEKEAEGRKKKVEKWELDLN
jgi:hypothetical protein